MKKTALTLTLTAIFPCLLMAQTLWKSDPYHSKLTFTVVHLGINDVFGLFQKFDAEVKTSNPNFSDAVVTLKADVASINTEVKMRDDDLRSARFFDVQQFPFLVFKSKRLEKSGDNRYKLTGDLTIHGITRPVTMELWYRGTINDAISKKTKSGFQLTGLLHRADFNVGPGFPFTEISDEVRIKADGEFIKQQ